MVFNTPLFATSTVVDQVARFLEPKMTVNVINAETSQAATTSEYEPGGTTYLAVSNGVAVIKVHGILTSRRGSINSACEEIVSYEKLQQQFDAALEAESVKEIVFDMNSGGGAAVGCYEFAEHIFNSRGIKKTSAIVNFHCYSACYFIAAACDEIYVSETGGVGSIGVRMEHMEISKLAEKEGYTFTTFSRGDRKADLSPYHELTPEARASVEEKMDVAYDLFVNSVAKYRGMSVKKVVATQADFFTGQLAIDTKLADYLMSPQEAINQIGARIESTNQATQKKSISLRAKAMEMNSKL